MKSTKRPSDWTVRRYAGENPRDSEFLIRAELWHVGFEAVKIKRGNIDSTGAATYHVWMRKKGE